MRPSDRADPPAIGGLTLAKEQAEPADVAARSSPPPISRGGDRRAGRPGFINLTLDAGFLESSSPTYAADDVGIVPATPQERIIVDCSTPNVAKEMHIGHLRTTVIGDALVRLLEAVGHDVVRENRIVTGAVRSAC